VNPRQRGHEPAVAFVGEQGDGAAFRNGEVGTANPHVGFEKGLAQLLASHLDHAVDIIGVLAGAGDLGEELRHFLAGQVNGRHHHMRRAFVTKLNDPFAEIGFRDLEAFLLQMIVEEGLFGGHGLAFDNFF